MKDIFTSYYYNSTWGSDESVSGPGSTVEHTVHTREEIKKIIQEFHIKSILDAPCGDYNWFRLIERDIPYIGGDIVEELMEKNNMLYGNDITLFAQIDITKDPLPNADLMMCRDCWCHFSDADIRKSIDNFLRSDIQYLLTTNCGIGENKDIETGGYRHLNLNMPPFSFGLPLKVISEWQWEGFPPKTLVLYNKGSIQ
jgi:SAM-dependent methyltransferase